MLADGLGPPPSAFPGWLQVLPPIPCTCCNFPRSSRNLKSPAPFFSIGRCPLKQPGINSTPRNNTHSITCLMLTCKTTPILLYPLSPVRRRRISGGNAKQIRSIPVLERNSVLNPVLSSSPSSPSSSSSSASSSSEVANLLNPESSAAVSGREGRPHKPRGTDPVLVQFKALQLTGVKESLQSKRKRRLKYFTRLAGQLASEGKLLEFVEFLQVRRVASFRILIPVVACFLCSESSSQRPDGLLWLCFASTEIGYQMPYFRCWQRQALIRQSSHRQWIWTKWMQGSA